MAAFQFPDPAITQTVKNPITGSTYQWKEDPGKWVLTVSIREVEDIIWEGDNQPNPIGDYKLWYSTDTLELYFHYCDINGVCAWVPTSAPITILENLQADVALALNKAGVAEASSNANVATIQLLDSAINEIENDLGKVTLQEVLDNGSIADKGATFGGKVIIEPGTSGNEAVTYQQLQDNASGEDYLPLSGGTLEGNLTVNGTGASGTAPLIVRKDGYYTSLVVDKSGNVYAGANETAYFSASKPSHLVTKGYLDPKLLHPGLGLRWKYNNGDYPNKGEFAIKSSFSFQISHTTHDNQDYFKVLCSQDHGSKTVGGLLTVYQIEAGKYKPCEVFELRKCRFGRNTGQMEFEYSGKAQAHSLTHGNIYYITVGGIF